MALILIKHGLENPVEKIKMKAAKDEDSIVLIQNGIFWAIGNDALKDVRGKIYALEEDLLARGYKKEDSKVELIDYASFLDVVEKEDKFIG